jgi:hypothetical protein
MWLKRARIREIAQRLPWPSPPCGADRRGHGGRRFYAMECAYANYELRTGCAFPPERRESEEAQELSAWRASLRRLEKALAEAERPR